MTLLLVVALPLLGALLVATLGGRLGRRWAGAVLTFGLALAFGAALAIAQAFAAGKTSLVAELVPWLPLRGADLALRVDPATVPLLVVLTAVAALAALFSIGASGRDDDPRRFGAAFGLTLAGALLVVVASNLMLLFAGWELAAVGTYLLVAHRRDRPAAAAAAVRSFVIARVGDAALLVAILALFTMFRTVDLAEIAQRVGGFSGQPDAVARLEAVLLAPSLLVLVAALARSAQLPFQVWLPDAAPAPTAGSALIHTAVTAGGVVLLVRLSPILPPSVLAAGAAIGGITAVVGAAAALAQTDPRRLLAWSTVSQLGLTFVAAGSGALFAAQFTLVAHALAKATVVLSGEVRPKRLGALAFAAGAVSLAVVAPAGGYLAVTAVASGFGARPDLFAVYIVTTILTGTYVWRMLMRPPVPAWLGAARFGARVDALYRVLTVEPFAATAHVLDRGSERVLEQSATLIGAAAMRAGELASAAHRRYARASEAIVLAAALALVAYWTLR
jgi:NADH-quinone oxidoreductase subunit L